MPLFTYECLDCGAISEYLVQSCNSDTPECIKCKKTNMEKHLGKSNFILKGFGWYRDGYSNKPSTPVDIPDDGPTPGSLIRIPEYSDRNTGKYLGTGTPEVL